APGWLVSRPTTSLHMAHGGAAYAIVPNAEQASVPDCHQDIEVLAPSGKSCGTARFVASGSACTTPQGTTSIIDVGYDGTVEQQSTQSCDDNLRCACTWQWWRGIL